MVEMLEMATSGEAVTMVFYVSLMENAWVYLEYLLIVIFSDENCEYYEYRRFYNLVISYSERCDVDGIDGDGKSQGNCGTGLLCLADGKCRGRV